MSGNSNSDIWIAGAVAAFSVDLLVYPLDTLKTRIQSPDYRQRYVDPHTHAVLPRAISRGLYQGVGSVILATLPSSGAFFTTYEGAKHVLSERTALPSPLAHAGASALAELVSCAILTPAEVIKQNAQMVSRPSAGAASATTQVLQRFRTNPLALWRGYGALASRNLPFTAMQFPMFEKFREQLEAWRQRATGPRRKQDVSVWENGVITAAAAGSAGAIAAVVTTPIDVVKTRIMLAAATSLAEPTSAPAAVQAVQEGKVVDALGSLSGSTGGKAESRKLSSWAIGQDVVAHEGWKGLWRGGALRGAWTLLGSGLYLGVYESGRVFLERRRQEQQQEE